MKKQISVKKVLILEVITILIFAGITYVFAATPSSTFYISSGVYPGAPSYTVWKEGSNYFAKDSNGQIDYSGTNATEITENIIANGNYLFFKTGIYDGLQALSLENNMIIEGEANTVLKLKDSASNHLFRIDGKQNITIKNLVFDGNGGAQSSQDRYCIYMYNNPSDITVENCVFTNFVGYAVYMYAASGTSNNIKIMNNKFINPQSTSNYAIIVLHFLEYSEISGNIIHGSSGSTDYAIFIKYSNHTVITNNIINGTGCGIAVWKSGTANLLSHHVTVSDNTISNLWNDTDSHWSILMLASHSSVMGNVIYNSARDAIVVSESHVTVTGNTISKVANPYVAIWSHAAVDVILNNAIAGNIIYDVGHGVVVTFNNGTTVTGNTIRLINDEGIQLFDSHNCTITSNTVFESSDYGIELSSASSYNILVSNVAYGTQAGIIDLGSNNQINLCYNGTTWIS